MKTGYEYGRMKKGSERIGRGKNNKKMWKTRIRNYVLGRKNKKKVWKKKQIWKGKKDFRL